MSMAETQDYDVVIKRLKEILKLPTAFFCCNDIEAITIIKGLSSMGIKITGRYINYRVFDDIELSKNISPKLTTMHIHKELLGEMAVRKLISQLTQKII